MNILNIAVKFYCKTKASFGAFRKLLFFNKSRSYENFLLKMSIDKRIRTRKLRFSKLDIHNKIYQFLGFLNACFGYSFAKSQRNFNVSFSEWKEIQCYKVRINLFSYKRELTFWMFDMFAIFLIEKAIVGWHFSFTRFWIKSAERSILNSNYASFRSWALQRFWKFFNARAERNSKN